MRRISRYGWLGAALTAMILLAVAFRQRGADAVRSSRPINDWNISELVEELNRMGVEVRLRSTQKDGVAGETAFLTCTDKSWRELNALNKDAKRSQEWRGVLYCERAGERDSTHLIRQWGDRSAVVGPFLFYGDAELLRRVRAALIPFAPSAAV